MSAPSEAASASGTFKTPSHVRIKGSNKTTIDPQAPWRHRGACRIILDNDGRELTPRERSHLFFPEEQINSGRPFNDSWAKQICKGCTVKKECLEVALLFREPGIWGGTDAKQRKDILEARESRKGL